MTPGECPLERMVDANQDFSLVIERLPVFQVVFKLFFELFENSLKTLHEKQVPVALRSYQVLFY